MDIPENVKRIIIRLKSHGFSAYASGETVRAMLMSDMLRDNSVVTSAPPSAVRGIFRGKNAVALPKGVAVLCGDGSVVTVFSFVNEPQEKRHIPPSRALIDVCAEYGFTVNSMLYEPDLGLIDYFGGRNDLKNKIIRCVDSTGMIFEEEPALGLRAVRLAAELSFSLFPDTESSIKKHSSAIKKADGEQIGDELNRLLLSPAPERVKELKNLGLLKHIMPELERCFGEPQRNKYHIYDVGDHIMAAVKYSKRTLLLRWAALMHDIGKPLCSHTDSDGIIHFYGHHIESRMIAQDILHRLRFDSELIRNVTILVENHDVRVEPAPPAVKRMMNRVGENLFEPLMLLQTADNLAKNPKYFPEKYKKINAALNIYRQALEEKQPYLPSHLAIGKKDLLRLGFSQGRSVSDAMKQLLDEVIREPALNSRAKLIERAKEMRKSRR